MSTVDPGGAAEASCGLGPVAITLIAHPDPRRIGQRVAVEPGRRLELSRDAPRFLAPSSKEGEALLVRSVSRGPVVVALHRDGAVVLDPRGSRTIVRLRGRRVVDPYELTPAEIARGAVVELGSQTAVVLHPQPPPLLPPPPVASAVSPGLEPPPPASLALPPPHATAKLTASRKTKRR